MAERGASPRGLHFCPLHVPRRTRHLTLLDRLELRCWPFRCVAPVAGLRGDLLAVRGRFRLSHHVVLGGLVDARYTNAANGTIVDDNVSAWGLPFLSMTVPRARQLLATCRRERRPSDWLRVCPAEVDDGSAPGSGEAGLLSGLWRPPPFSHQCRRSLPSSWRHHVRLDHRHRLQLSSSCRSWRGEECRTPVVVGCALCGCSSRMVAPRDGLCRYRVCRS